MDQAVILDNEAVQALADPAHRKHRRVLAVIEAAAARARRDPAARAALIIPAAVQVEAGWDRRDPRTAALNRLRAHRPPLDEAAADRAAAVVAALGVSVADAHLAEVLTRHDGERVILTSDPDDLGRIIAHTGAAARLVTI
ncbi:MAG: hypothetical protein ACKVWR_15045 [Acidimicrobiales bacterium]